MKRISMKARRFVSTLALLLAGLGLWLTQQAQSCGMGFSCTATAPNPEAALRRSPQVSLDQCLQEIFAREKAVVPERSVLCAEGRSSYKEDKDGQWLYIEYWEEFGRVEEELLAQERQEQGMESGLPADFALYRELLEMQVYDELEAKTRQILALPVKERRRTSVMAAYRVCRAAAWAFDQEAVDRWAERTRSLAAEGLPDPLGLAAMSYGWQGFVHYHHQDFDQALLCYFKQGACGDPTALESCQMSLTKLLALRSDEAFQRQVGDERILMLVLVRAMRLYDMQLGGDCEQEALLRWSARLDAILKSRRQVPGAGLLALACYHAARYEDCERLAAAEPGRLLSRWLLAKCAYRKGAVEATQEHYRQLLTMQEDVALEPGKGFVAVEPEEQEGRLIVDGAASAAMAVRNELALLELKAGHWEQALTLFLQGGGQVEALYLAEQVLSVDELLRYAKNLPPELQGVHLPEDGLNNLLGNDFKSATVLIRGLAARRLLRAGRGEEALPLFEEWQRDAVRRYLELRRQGGDVQLDAGVRAQALWEAALLCRAQGMEMMGTWLGPDYAIYSGNSEGLSLFFWGGSGMDYVGERHLRPATGPYAPSEDELQRVHQHVDLSLSRFHYREVAADLAWESCRLQPVPDQAAQEELAQRLHTAGLWLARREPGKADRFYKALVRRCRGTALGRVADQKRWFLREDDLMQVAVLDPKLKRDLVRKLSVTIAAGILTLGLLQLWRSRRRIQLQPDWKAP